MGFLISSGFDIRDLDADAGALSRLAAQLETSPQQMGAFAHAQQAEAVFIFIDVAGVKPSAVVLRQKDDARVALDDG
jgi:hypothetical protein